MEKEFWKEKKVLITGNNGFKGCWLNKWLDMMEAYTCGVSLKAEQESVYTELEFSERHSYYEMDIRNREQIVEVVQQFQPEIVFHLAAQAIVKVAADNPWDTFSTNVMGTVNLLEALRTSENIKAIVVVTSDKVYENIDEYVSFTEDARLGGDEPYSASKACEELVAKAYRDSYFSNKNVGVATARASNTFGGGDHHFDRLLPYLMKSVYENNPIVLRNPHAIRPWQYILDLMRGYLQLAECLYQNPLQYSQAYNFGPKEDDLYTVGEIVAFIEKEHVKETEKKFKEANVLMINSQKSKCELGWEPFYSVKEGIRHTKNIYEAYFNGTRMNDLMEKEIRGYEQNERITIRHTR